MESRFKYLDNQKKVKKEMSEKIKKLKIPENFMKKQISLPNLQV